MASSRDQWKVVRELLGAAIDRLGIEEHEIGELATSFNHMAVELHNREDALKEALAQARTIAATLLLLVAAYHVVDALQVVAVSALRGYKRTLVPLLVSAGAIALGVFLLVGIGRRGGPTIP